MDGIHDLGGQGFGPVDVDEPKEVFHEAWEGRVWGIVKAHARLAFTDALSIRRDGHRRPDQPLRRRAHPYCSLRSGETITQPPARRAARLCRTEPLGHNLAREVRTASALEPAERALSREGIDLSVLDAC